MSETHSDVSDLLLLSGFSTEAIKSLSTEALKNLGLVFSESSEAVTVEQAPGAVEEPADDPPIGSPTGLAGWIVGKVGIVLDKAERVSSSELRDMAAVVVEVVVEQVQPIEQGDDVPGLLTLLFLREGFEGSQKIEPDMREDTLRTDARQIAEQIQTIKQALGSNALRAKVERGRNTQTVVSHDRSVAPAQPSLSALSGDSAGVESGESEAAAVDVPPPDEEPPKPKKKSNRMPKFAEGEEIAFARRILRGPRKNWWNGAACKGSDPEAYFVEGAAQNSIAPSCRRCPVMLDCRLDALNSYEDFGVWGGWTEYNRRAWMIYIMANWGSLENWAEDIIGQWQAAQEKSTEQGQARPAVPQSQKTAQRRRTPPNSSGDPEIPAPVRFRNFPCIGIVLNRLRGCLYNSFEVCARKQRWSTPFMLAFFMISGKY